MTDPQHNQITQQTRAAGIGRQVARLERRLSSLQFNADRLSFLRLIVFLIGFGLCLAALYRSLSLFLIALPVAIIAFGASVAVHRRYNQAIQRHKRYRTIKQTHLARMSLAWSAIPAPPETRQAEHPFELDLDLSGARSVHHLIDTAASAEGSLRLKRWLLETHPTAATIHERQARVRELIDRPAFREKLTLRAAPASTSGRVRDEDLVAWLQTETPALPGWVLPVLIPLGALNVLLTVVDFSTPVAPELRAGLLAAYVLIYLLNAGYMRDLFEAVLTIGAAFRSLESLFRLIERVPTGDAIGTLCAPFQNADRPSAQLRRVNRVMAAGSVRGNPMLWIILNAITPWDLIVAVQLRRVKIALGGQLPRWLDVWHELEALGSLANYAYLTPAAVFPTLVAGTPIIRARGLGHPLIPEANKVRNDFELGEAGNLVLITGSNMAGKSSFLRTVGINCILAYAGGVVDAAAMTVSVCRVYTSMRVTDSVNDGISYFYAEVRRLKALLTDLEQPDAAPLLYLIDEIFRGTNNRERLIGSRSYLRALVGKNGAGIVSTHDLELVHLADELPSLTNYHFREEVIDGEMIFDYTLRVGPCPTTNALKVMKAAGLPVEGQL